MRTAQAAAVVKRLPADELLADVKGELAPALRLFGFRFTTSPGETPESEPEWSA